MTAKILIVDDDPELLRLIGVALKRAGYKPIAAQTAEDALNKVRSQAPDLIILDVMLPGVSGIELCRKLRSQSSSTSLPIIMLSARAQVEDKIEGLEAGADDYLTKPISPKEMVARVASQLQRVERLRSVASAGRGQVIGFLGAKGGVGTTTMALNVAFALALKEQKVVVAEFRPHFGTFSVQLGHEPSETLQGLIADGSGPLHERAIRAHLITDPIGVDVLYGPNDSDALLAIEAEQAEQLVDGLARLAETVIIDFAGNFSPATEAALRRCDHVVLVTRPEEDSLIAGRKVLDLIKNWGIRRGVVDAVVVNHVQLAMGLNVEQAQEELDCPIIGVIPPAADACALVHRRGRPLLVSQPNNQAVNSIKQVADRIMEQAVV